MTPRTRAYAMTFPLTALAIASVLFAGCGGSHSEEEVTASAPVPVTTRLVVRGTVEAVISATGLIAAAPGAELIVVAPQPARVGRVPKAEGDTVRKGDLLVEFDIPSSQADVAAREAEVAQARARLANARAALTRVQGLFERGVAARKEVEDAQRELTDAEAVLANSEVARASAHRVAARTTVVAPFSGVVAKRWHNPGDLVEAASTDPVLRLVDPARAEVTVAVPASVANRVRPGQQARIRAAFDEEPGGATSSGGASSTPLNFWPAAVLTRPTVVDPTTATASARVALRARARSAATGSAARTAARSATSRATPPATPPATSPEAPPPPPIGTAVRIDIVTDVHNGTLTVPASAIVREDGHTVVYTVGTDHKAHRHVVTVGIASESAVEILAGVSQGDAVIVRGQEALPDGAAVRVGDAAEGAESPGSDKEDKEKPSTSKSTEKPEQSDKSEKPAPEKPAATADEKPAAAPAPTPKSPR